MRAAEPDRRPSAGDFGRPPSPLPVIAKRDEGIVNGDIVRRIELPITREVVRLDFAARSSQKRRDEVEEKNSALIRRTVSAVGQGVRSYAFAAAGVLILAGMGAGAAHGAGASDVPASALKGKKLAFVACSDLNRWCREFRKAIVGGLEAKGVIVTDLQDPYDPVLQAQHLDQAIAQKPDLIALLPTNARSVVPSLRRAKAAGIPVINLVGPTVPESKDYYIASIENGHHELGEDAATNIVEGLKKEGRDKANIMVITGAQVQPEVAVRMDGFNSVMAKYPQYKVVEVQDGNWDQGKSGEIARTIFAKYADKGGIQAAFGMADHMAAGIIQAAQQAGIPVGVDKKGLVVTASNCFAIGMVNIANGLQYGTATQAPEPTALFALPLIEKALAGEAIPKRSLYQETRITKDNVDKWKTFCGSA